jgi:hypothetical protein
LSNVSEVLAASIIRAVIALMMESPSTLGTSINFCQTTRQNNPEDSHLHVFILFHFDLLMPRVKYFAGAATESHVRLTTETSSG